jgi:hypothetical protein
VKHFALIVVNLLSTICVAQQATSTKPTVSIDSNYPAIGSGAANAFRKQVGQLTLYLQTDCGLKVTIKADKANYLVKLTYTEWGWMHRAVKVEIANPEGDTITTTENTKSGFRGFEKDYQQVCSIILTDWSSRQDRKP